MSRTEPPATLGAADYAPLSRRPVTEVITDVITERIRSGALKPGDKLPAEPELARQLQVGRGSLREAIRTLHTLGVLQVVRGRGTFVSEPMSQPHSAQFVGLSSVSGPALAEILELRIGLETAAVALACVRATAEDLDEMRARAADHETAVKEGDVHDRARTDEEFHDSIVRAAHNTQLYSMYQMIVPQMAGFRLETLKVERSSQRFVPGHRDIISGITAREPRVSSNAAARHIAGLYRELRTAVEESGAEPGSMLDFPVLLASFTTDP
ncbi:FadR/GntR family transcriptional regulator [Amycolatopsis jejuensis]|uniref:FadR/GntR family transcriptional regulator n=1 Tax=Amycolatopsis jejuensis TaxID=330084 RepID=UPI00068CD410|nr:FadR/GntR family transcriptional regulator [Amycolatopsis jejuensis]